MSKKRTCLACGREYKYCPTCGADASKPKWMKDFDTEACKDLFNAVSAIGMGTGTKDTLQRVVTIHQIKDYSIYKDSIKNALEELGTLEEKRIKKARGKRAEFNAIDDAPIETDIELDNTDEVSE